MVPMSASEQVLAQLGRQKRAVDTRDAERPHGSLHGRQRPGGRPGRAGRAQGANRLRGRDEIIGAITAGWERTAATRYPGALIHRSAAW